MGTSRHLRHWPPLIYVIAFSSLQLGQLQIYICLIEEFGVYGKDGDTVAIIELLLADDGSGYNTSVIPIVGMDEVGKITLAQLLYNKKLVVEHLDVRT